MEMNVNISINVHVEFINQGDRNRNKLALKKRH